MYNYMTLYKLGAERYAITGLVNFQQKSNTVNDVKSCAGRLFNFRGA